MKKHLLFILPLLIIISCSGEKTKQEQIIQDAEKMIKASMDDPSSYEFVSITLDDSITVKHNFDYIRQDLVDDIKIQGNNVESQLYYKKEVPNLFDAAELEKAQKKINIAKLKIAAIDSVGKIIKGNMNDIAAYKYWLVCRGKNAFNATVKTKFLVFVSPEDNKIVELAAANQPLSLAPNTFPGYPEIAARFKE